MLCNCVHIICMKSTLYYIAVCILFLLDRSTLCMHIIYIRSTFCNFIHIIVIRREYLILKNCTHIMVLDRSM